MNTSRNDEIKKILQEPEIPENLTPASVKKALDAQQSRSKKIQQKKKRIQWIAGAVACGVVLSTGGYAAYRAGIGHTSDVLSALTVSAGSYTKAAESYEQIHAILGHYMEQQVYGGEYGIDGEIYEEMAEESSNSLATATGADTGSAEYSETYNQEQGVLESDITLTDGQYIYTTLGTSYRNDVEIVPVENGTFGSGFSLDIEDDFPEPVSGVNIHSMYLKDGRLIVLVNASGHTENERQKKERTYVLTYQTGAEPIFLGCYAQDGILSDVRLMEDGSLYLVTDDIWYSSYYKDDVMCCIPEYGTNGEYTSAAPEEILLPDFEVDEETSEIQYDFSDSFINIGSINVLSDAPADSMDFKSLAGFGGEMYCSLNYIYLSCYSWTGGEAYTDFTRLSIDSGIITSAGTATVLGYIKDQFSMSEYNGYFRVAVTQEHRTESIDEMVASMSISRDNALYIFDDQMQQVGALEGFAETETIKSVSFQGDLAYIVTYRQTDPLFAMDLSDPYHPVILDEYKINGYSSYMQQWDENHLLGFGVDADEQGIEQGLKLVMFDNSDPSSLAECGITVMRYEEFASVVLDPVNYGYIHSIAQYERKALLIAPEKNLIAVPFECYQYSHRSEAELFQIDYGYVLYSYLDGSFLQEGVFYSNTDFERALYIENTVYLISSSEMIAVDLDTMQETDRFTYEYVYG
ncbi:MAG: beta-propeller domain-containing protein [Ruminococcus sp.]